MSSNSSVVLLVDDDPNDILFMTRALKQSGLRQSLRVVSDGQEALDYFNGVAPYHDRTLYPLPCLVLLDIKMPRVNGLELLSWMREHPEFRNMPVCMVTSSDEPKDRETAEAFGIEAYCVKPVSIRNLQQLAGLIRVEAEEHCENPEECQNG